MHISALPVLHILKTQQFSVADLEGLFKTAEEFKSACTPKFADRIMCSLFYEPSTRTRFSFESAMLRLGGSIIGSDNAKFSSAAKGESLEDTIRVVNHYADIIVLRHYETNAAERAAGVSRVPVINAGCGSGQHPTQSLADVYTIWRRKKSLANLRIAMMGDLRARVVRSLAYLTGKFPGVKLYFASPEGLGIEQDMRMHFREHGVWFAEYESVEDIIDIVDVLYVVRVQLERMHPDDREKFNGSYFLHRGIAQRMREGSLIMHPLPRTRELPIDIDVLPGAVYLTEQVESGLLIRMALLAHLLSGQHQFASGLPTAPYHGVEKARMDA